MYIIVEQLGSAARRGGARWETQRCLTVSLHIRLQTKRIADHLHDQGQG